jgi:hypothetical protein
MKTQIGGDRIGSGNKQEVSLKNFGRSTHDLSYLWRSSMASGTLVPFIDELALPGDAIDIDLNIECKTLPTIGPLFGSYKIQLDVFEIPLRLYNAKLHMNKLNIGMDMGSIYLPQVELRTNNHADYVQKFTDNEHINPSCVFRYLGMTGLGRITGTTNPATREMNACSYLSMWDVYKNYYANKQEEKGYVIHSTSSGIAEATTAIGAVKQDSYGNQLNILDNAETAVTGELILVQYPTNCPDLSYPGNQTVEDNGAGPAVFSDMCENVDWNNTTKLLQGTLKSAYTGHTINIIPDSMASDTDFEISQPVAFDLARIDDMRENILQYAGAGAYVIDSSDNEPYSWPLKSVRGSNETVTYGMQYSQEGLPIKTYQSDLFNNWMETEWLDGVDGVNQVTAIDTSGGEFTIDALNLATKVYNMLNRIAISGGSYDDWLDAVYTQDRVKAIESPVYHGSLIKELAFEEVISNSSGAGAESEYQPLGQLAGRGRLTNKHKGGKMRIKVNEPSIILGLASITPRIEYSQGNKWHVNLKTYDDFHKPSLDAIGFQDLIIEQMLATDTALNSDTGELTQHSIGKQPAWINYMTNVNKVYGNFADQNKEMFMTLNRRYEADEDDGTILDATTYIDPSKFNHIFADTNPDSQNFWMHIAVNMFARRKMSAKVIPNL